jgi:ABC-type polysaccharide/polyol phosphate transport system ATPase subunit
LRAGEIRLRGVGKRYRFRSDAGDLLGEAQVEDGDADDEDDDVSKALSWFRAQYAEIWALRGIDCCIEPGDRVAIIGANGSGKSTLIRILSRTMPPSEGKVEGVGIVLPFAALRSPLSPHESGCDNLRMLARLLGIDLGHLEERLPQIIEFSELGSLAHEKVSRYSDYSFARLSMAMGLLIDADIYLIDDSLKVGDELYRHKFQKKFSEVLTRQVTLIFASNSLEQLRMYCRRALWLDRGALVADGEINGVISRFLSKTDEAIDFEDLTSGPSQAATDGQVPVAPAQALPADDAATAESQAEAAPGRRTGIMKVTTAVNVPAERRQPVADWLERMDHAENAWRRVIDRWREKLGQQGPMTSMEIAETSKLATVHSLSCLNATGKAVRSALPGEPLSIELLVETLEPDVTVAVRLELDAPPLIIFAAEPLVPLIAPEPGQYLFEAELDAGLLAHHFETSAYKLRTRVLVSKTDAEAKEMMIATVHLKLRGDLRYSFDEWRIEQGDPVTSIVNPTPAFVGAVEGAPDPDAQASARMMMTTWDKLTRRPLLRPRLKWMIYRVLPEPAGEGGAKTLIEQGLS